MRRLVGFSLALLTALAPLAAAAVRGDVRYGRPSDPLLEPRFKVFDLAWRKAYVERGLLELAPRELAGPAVDPLSGELAVATSDGKVRLLTSTGREIWHVTLPAQPTSAPLLTPDGIFLGAADGSLHALDRFAGDTLWTAYVGGEIIAEPIYEAGAVFVGTDHDGVHAIDAFSGEVRWVYRRDTRQNLTIRGGTGPSFGDGRIYAGFSDGAVVALGPDDGRMIWEAELAPAELEKFPDSDAAPVYRDGLVFVTVFNKGTQALDASTGRVRWTADTRGATTLALADDLLLVGGAGMWALDPTTGAVRWTVALGENYVTRPVAVRKVVAASGSMGVIFLERDTGRPLRVFAPGSDFASPVAARGRHLYGLSNLGYLYALELVAE